MYFSFLRILHIYKKHTPIHIFMLGDFNESI